MNGEAKERGGRIWAIGWPTSRRRCPGRAGRLVRAQSQGTVPIFVSRKWTVPFGPLRPGEGTCHEPESAASSLSIRRTYCRTAGTSPPGSRIIARRRCRCRGAQFDGPVIHADLRTTSRHRTIVVRILLSIERPFSVARRQTEGGVRRSARSRSAVAHRVECPRVAIDRVRPFGCRSKRRRELRTQETSKPPATISGFKGLRPFIAAAAVPAASCKTDRSVFAGARARPAPAGAPAATSPILARRPRRTGSRRWPRRRPASRPAAPRLPVDATHQRPLFIAAIPGQRCRRLQRLDGLGHDFRPMPSPGKTAICFCGEPGAKKWISRLRFRWLSSDYSRDLQRRPATAPVPGSISLQGRLRGRLRSPICGWFFGSRRRESPPAARS